MRILQHTGARADLEDLYDREPDAADEISALLQEAKSNPEILDLFTAHDFGKDQTERFHVSRWIEQQRAGRNLWRIKIWALENLGLKYRIVYTLNPLTQTYYVLGIVDRDFNYDENHPVTQRMLAAYAKLEIPGFSGTH